MGHVVKSKTSQQAADPPIGRQRTVRGGLAFTASRTATSPGARPCIERIIGHINEQYRNQFRLKYDGRTVSVEMLALDSQVVLSSVKPLRPQLVEEFTRVSMFFGYLAQVMNDDDWSNDERDAYETCETWGMVVHGERRLIV